MNEENDDDALKLQTIRYKREATRQLEIKNDQKLGLLVTKSLLTTTLAKALCDIKDYLQGLDDDLVGLGVDQEIAKKVAKIVSSKVMQMHQSALSLLQKTTDTDMEDQDDQ